MSDKIEGYLEVGLNENDEIVINHPDLKPDANGVGHIVFSAHQAQHLSNLLATKVCQAINNMRQKALAAKQKAAEAIPVDHSARTLTDGSPVTPEALSINSATGMQKGYVVLSGAERAKGFVRPVRRSYRHDKCGGTTTMGLALAETYARSPTFYGATFCCNCSKHFPVGENGEFVWIENDGTIGPKVGT